MSDLELLADVAIFLTVLAVFIFVWRNPELNPAKMFFDKLLRAGVEQEMVMRQDREACMRERTKLLSGGGSVALASNKAGPSGPVGRGGAKASPTPSKQVPAATSTTSADPDDESNCRARAKSLED
ncbi:unnamed protein product [Amoebophrya sp. A25]|nr:unnamed protein product [Amoebophrya sp. A25]|eukprot:GSA25T00010587001.1